MDRRRLLQAFGALSLGAAGLACGSPAAMAAPARTPSDVLPLTNWWLTLPTGAPAAEIVKDLRGFEKDPWFVDEAGGVRFRANVGGATTSGSVYPRCELRELNPDRSQASWSFTKGTHVLNATVAVTRTPVRKPEVCFAQVHGTSGDLLMLYYDAKAGGIRWKLDSTIKPKVLDYRLGDRLAVQIRVSGGRGEVRLNGIKRIDFTSTSSTCYFRAGAYVLSNPSKGDAPDALGETVVSALRVTHS